MSNHDFNTFEQRLVAALHQEASLTMTLTDTPRELRRWRDNQHKRRTRTRIVAIAAAAAAVAGLILGITKLGSTASHRNEPAHKPSPAQQHQSTIETLQPLPSSVSPAVLHGAGTVDTVAFGAVWGINISDRSKFIYRMAPDGRHVLHRTDLTRYIGDPVPSFRIGDVVLMPSVNGSSHAGYVVLDRTGRQTGFIRVSTAGAGGGDATGGWVQTDFDRIAQVDRSGRLTGTRVRLPDQSISSITSGAGSVWVGSITGELYRLDPATGRVLAKAATPGEPLQVAVANSAVYVATDRYQLLRLDPTSLKVTAVSQNNVRPGALDQIALGSDGSLWVAPDQRGVAQLDPVTLEVVRSVQVSKASRDGGNYGIALVGGRVFVGDGDNNRVVSFPAS